MQFGSGAPESPAFEAKRKQPGMLVALLHSTRYAGRREYWRIRRLRIRLGPRRRGYATETYETNSRRDSCDWLQRTDRVRRGIVVAAGGSKKGDCGWV